jgi:hypothetical protein
MKLFDINNPIHKKILREEIIRTKKILQEGYQYSVDEIWKEMSDDERYDAIAATRDDEGPDLADQYASGTWDEIPADIQDSIDLSKYQLAKYDMGGRSMLRGIDTALKQNPSSKTFVDKFVQKVKRSDLRNITVTQSYQLNVGLWNYIESKNPKSTNTDVSNSDDAVKGAWLDAERRAGRTSGLD